MLPCYAFSPVSPLIISISFCPPPTIPRFFTYFSSFLYSHLWTQPFSLTPACQLFPIPPGEYVPLHGLNHLLLLTLIVNKHSGQSLKITNKKLELSTHWLLLHECGLLPLSVSGLPEGLPTLYSKALLRKMVSCGVLRPRPLPPTPSSLGSCQPQVFPLSDWLQRWVVSWRVCVRVQVCERASDTVWGNINLSWYSLYCTVAWLNRLKCTNN